MREYIENNKGMAVEVPRLNDKDVARGAETPHPTSLRSATLPRGGGLKRRRAVAMLLCFVMLFTGGCKSILVSGDLSFKAYDPVSPMGAEDGLRNVIMAYGDIDMEKYQVDGDAAFWLPPYHLNPIYLQNDEAAAQLADFKVLGYEAKSGDLYYAYVVPYFGTGDGSTLGIAESGKADDIELPSPVGAFGNGAVKVLMCYNPDSHNYHVIFYQYYTKEVYESGEVRLLAGQTTGGGFYYIYDQDMLNIYDTEGKLAANAAYGPIISNKAYELATERLDNDSYIFWKGYALYRLVGYNPVVRATVTDIQVDGNLMAYFSVQVEMARDQATLNAANKSAANGEEVDNDSYFSDYDDVKDDDGGSTSTSTSSETNGYEFINGVLYFNFSFSTAMLDIGGEDSDIQFISRLPEEYVEKLKELGSMETLYVVDDAEGETYSEWCKKVTKQRSFQAADGALKGLRPVSELNVKEAITEAVKKREAAGASEDEEDDDDYYGVFGESTKQKKEKEAEEKVRLLVEEIDPEDYYSGDEWITDDSLYGNKNISLSYYKSASQKAYELENQLKAKEAAEKKVKAGEKDVEIPKLSLSEEDVWAAIKEEVRGDGEAWTLKSWEGQNFEEKYMAQTPLLTQIMNSFPIFDTSDKEDGSSALYMALGVADTKHDSGAFGNMWSFPATTPEGEEATVFADLELETEGLLNDDNPWYDGYLGFTAKGIKRYISEVAAALTGVSSLSSNDEGANKKDDSRNDWVYGFFGLGEWEDESSVGMNLRVYSYTPGREFFDVEKIDASGFVLPWAVPGAYNYSGARAYSWQPEMEDGSKPVCYNTPPLDMVNKYKPDASGLFKLDRYNLLRRDMPLILPYITLSYSDGSSVGQYTALDYDIDGDGYGLIYDMGNYPLPRMEVYDTETITITDKLILEWKGHREEMGTVSRTVQIPTAYRLVYPDGMRIVLGGQTNIGDGVKALPRLGSVYYSGHQWTELAGWTEATHDTEQIRALIENDESYTDVWIKSRYERVAAMVPGQPLDMTSFDRGDYSIFVLFTSELTRFYRYRDGDWEWAISGGEVSGQYSLRGDNKPYDYDTRRNDYLSITNEQLSEAKGYGLSVSSETDTEGLSGTDKIAAEAQESEVSFTLSAEKLYPYTDYKMLALVDNDGVNLIDASNTARLRILPLLSGHYYNVLPGAKSGEFLLVGFQTEEYEYNASDMAMAKIYRVNLGKIVEQQEYDNVAQYLEQLRDTYQSETHKILEKADGTYQIVEPSLTTGDYLRAKNLFTDSEEKRVEELDKICAEYGTKRNDDITDRARELAEQIKDQRRALNDYYELIGIQMNKLGIPDNYKYLMWEGDVFAATYDRMLEITLVMMVLDDAYMDNTLTHTITTGSRLGVSSEGVVSEEYKEYRKAYKEWLTTRLETEQLVGSVSDNSVSGNSVSGNATALTDDDADLEGIMRDVVQERLGASDVESITDMDFYQSVLRDIREKYEQDTDTSGQSLTGDMEILSDTEAEEEERLPGWEEYLSSLFVRISPDYAVDPFEEMKERGRTLFYQISGLPKGDADGVVSYDKELLETELGAAREKWEVEALIIKYNLQTGKYGGMQSWVDGWNEFDEKAWEDADTAWEALKKLGAYQIIRERKKAILAEGLGKSWNEALGNILRDAGDMMARQEIQ